MNVLELAGFYSNYGSNFIPSLEFLDKEIMGLGHHVFYVFSNKNLSAKFYEWEKPFASTHNTILMNFSNISFVSNVVKYIKNNNITVVHAHFCASLYLSMVKRRCPKEVKFYEHIHSSPFNNNRGFAAFLRRIRNFILLDKNILKICVSESLVSMVKYVFPKQNVISCLNAIDFNRLRESSRNNLDEFSVLLFGYNYYVKGVDIAIDAIIKLQNKINVHMDIVMSDHYDDNINIIKNKYGKIPDCVSILEPIPNVVDLYKTHSVYLNASRSEGLSYANLEAYYCGAFCILSNIPQNKEAGLPNVLYFESKNSTDLSNKILDSYKTIKFYSNDINYLKQKFNINAWSNRIIKILKL